MASAATIFHIISVIISSVTFGLGTVNYGLLSIIVTTTAAFFTLAYNTFILVHTWRRNRAATTQASASFTTITPMKQNNENNLSKYKITPYPIPTYTSFPLDGEGNAKPQPQQEKQTNLRITIPPVPQTPRNSDKPSGPLYTLTSLFLLMFLAVATITALGMTINTSIGGPSILLAAERAKGVTFPWHSKIQTVVCTFLGLQLLLIIIGVVMCMVGRRSKLEKKMKKLEAEAYVYSSPQDPRLQFPWNV